MPDPNFTVAPMTLEDQIKAEAARLGFVLSGICLPETPPHYAAYLKWLEDGCHAGMAYMARPEAILQRYDPHSLLPACQSILVLGMPYPSPRTYPKPQSELPTGRIASYAWGTDYHKHIHQQLDKLIDFIANLTDADLIVKACVDTAPILEKDYAQQAGLGLIGKNSCFVTQEFGSYVFLAEVLLSLPLMADTPYQVNYCQDCLRCILACPTKAIRPDRSIDARRCLSYLTIEHRGPVPETLRPYLDDQIFGCELCQSVCPYNRGSLPEDIGDAFNPVLDPYPDLIPELALNESAFTQKYRDTAILRAKWQGYRRNIIIALGNHPHPAARSILETLSQSDPDPVIREACTWALTLF